MRAKGTAARRALTQDNATWWAFDLRGSLLFDPSVAPIRLQFTVVAAAGWPEVVARPVRGWEVVLESRQPFTGTVHLEAYQGDAVE